MKRNYTKQIAHNAGGNTLPTEFTYTRRAKESANMLIRKQVMEEWYEAPEGTDKIRNVRTISSIVSELINKMPWLYEEPIDPAELHRGWLQAAGVFISTQSELATISQGVAVVRVLQPTVRHELVRLTPHLLTKLKEAFPHENILSLNIRIG